MTFRENINRICKERGTNLTTLVKMCGCSSSKATAINNGSIPKEELLVAFAEALNCSVMDFFKDEVEEKSTLDRVAVLSEDERDVIEIFRSMSREDKHIMLARMYEYKKELGRKQEGRIK